MTTLTLDAAVARRLAIERQRLAGESSQAGAQTILDLARDLRCIQVDPTNVVARTQLLVLWSRLGSYDPGLLDRLLWEDKALFHYWAHAASLVLTEDYPIHSFRMRRWARGDSAWSERVNAWMRANAALRRYILAELRRRGPLRSRDLEDRSSVAWDSTGWTGGRNVGRMLDFLWAQGKVMIAGRSGTERMWHVADRWLPGCTPRDVLGEERVVEHAAQISLRCLGVATQRQITQHFIRDGYPGLTRALARLEAKGRIVRATVAGIGGGTQAPWYVHAEDVETIERLRSDDWAGRTTLLSPFDNLICDRRRTEDMFGFRYRIEIYLPKSKRRYGYFAMPILRDDRLIGRIDPAFHRKSGELVINAVHAEPDAPRDRPTGEAIASAVSELARFLGATGVRLDDDSTPEAWRRGLVRSL
ncbi:winged helix-turn-helix domain-containing protein [soil metagenome]